MKISWLGHACFKLTTNEGTSIVIDPYDPNTGYGALRTSADVVITSHSHHDHAWLEAVEGCKATVNAEGTFLFRDVTIETLTSFHDDVGGAKRGKNLLTRIMADGQCVVHLGDLGHKPNAQQMSFIADADVLLVPIGGYFTIDTRTAVEIIEEAKPKAVIPMHYKTAKNDYPISTADEFIALTHCQRIGECVAEVSRLSGAVIPERKRA